MPPHQLHVGTLTKEDPVELEEEDLGRGRERWPLPQVGPAACPVHRPPAGGASLLQLVWEPSAGNGYWGNGHCGQQLDFLSTCPSPGPALLWVRTAHLEWQGRPQASPHTNQLFPRGQAGVWSAVGTWGHPAGGPLHGRGRPWDAGPGTDLVLCLLPVQLQDLQQPLHVHARVRRLVLLHHLWAELSAQPSSTSTPARAGQRLNPQHGQSPAATRGLQDCSLRWAPPAP